MNYDYESSDESSDDDFGYVVAMAYGAYEETIAGHQPQRHRGSVPGRRVTPRDREGGHARIYANYFADPPVYSASQFRRRFRMNRHLFLRINVAVEDHDSYFVQKRDALGRLGLSSLQKIIAAFRMLTHGAVADFVDDQIEIGESTTIECLRKLVKAIVEIFGDEYLRSPNASDTARLLALHEHHHGFPGMLGSIDCMHWKWEKCLSAWHGMYTGHVHKPTIILEAVASYDLWIWHAFFGMLGSHNDINVLDRSNVFANLAEGIALAVNYTINGTNYTMGYYLADGIYPQWSTIVKTIPEPRGNKNKHFATKQESARKDVERAFGVLQARFAIVRGPARLWDKETLAYIMKACIILHNMIVEDERDDDNTLISDYDEIGETVSVSREHAAGFSEFIQNHHQIRNRQIHCQLQNDLAEHLWQLHGS